MTGWLLAITGTAIAAGAIVAYGLAVPSGDNPRVPIGTGLGLALGSAIGLGAWLTPSPSLALRLLGFAPMMLTGVALAIHSQRRVPTSELRVSVGDRLLAFEALTPEGERFRSSELAGRRVLLKFFRGEWCPFCQAELRRFDAMESELRRAGVEVVALSKDSPEAARHHRDRDGLRLRLLCDPELDVIRRYGVLHRKALQVAGKGRLRLFGLTVGSVASFQTMAAPTTLLIDENGVIRWIDQTDDYKVRSNTRRVLRAVYAAFGLPAPLGHEPVPSDTEVAEPCVDC